MENNRVSSLDAGYEEGMLSVFPEAIDDKNSLYEAKNNAETVLKQTLTYNGKQIIVESTDGFPDAGLIRIGYKSVAQESELIYYDKKTSIGFSNLIRGFAGSKQNSWRANETFVSCSVMAEHHNAIKDAIIQIEKTLGLSAFPDEDSINGKLKKLESKFLAPKASFKAFPLKGPSPLTVSFKNFSSGDSIRFFWDFGDGNTSIEKDPIHTFASEGKKTIKLNVITSTGAQGATSKLDYILVDNAEVVQTFYVVPSDSDLPNYSQETADLNSSTPQIFKFVDQTDGDVLQRYFIFDDGENITLSDPDIHTTTHVYEKPGEYSPTLLVVLANKGLKRVFLSNTITVI